MPDISKEDLKMIKQNEQTPNEAQNFIEIEEIILTKDIYHNCCHINLD